MQRSKHPDGYYCNHRRLDDSFDPYYSLKQKIAQMTIKNTTHIYKAMLSRLERLAEWASDKVGTTGLTTQLRE